MDFLAGFSIIYGSLVLLMEFILPVSYKELIFVKAGYLGVIFITIVAIAMILLGLYVQNYAASTECDIKLKAHYLRILLALNLVMIAVSVFLFGRWMMCYVTRTINTWTLPMQCRFMQNKLKDVIIVTEDTSNTSNPRIIIDDWLKDYKEYYDGDEHDIKDSQHISVTFFYYDVPICKALEMQKILDINQKQIRTKVQISNAPLKKLSKNKATKPYKPGKAAKTKKWKFRKSRKPVLV